MDATRSFVSALNVKLLIGHSAGTCDSIRNLTSEKLDEAVVLATGSLYGNDPLNRDGKSLQHVILNAQRTRVCRVGGCQCCCDLTEPTLAWAIFGVLFNSPLAQSVNELMIRNRGAGGFVVLRSDLRKHWQTYIKGSPKAPILLHEEASLAAIFLCHSPGCQFHNPFWLARRHQNCRDITLEINEP